jgi:hypothetical protein
MIGARTLLAFAVLVMVAVGGAFGIAQRANGATQQPLGEVTPLAAAGNGGVSFGVVFTAASYGNLEANSVAVVQADLSMLLSTGVQCIRIDIGYAPWLQNNQTAISEMTSLVQQIKAAGRCLIIADAASESYRKGGQLTWSQFMAAWGPRVSALAALYQPNYYIVIKEPGWYVPLVSDAATNPQFQNVSVWLSLTQNLTNDVHAASPSTVVGVSIAANGLTTSEGPFYVQYLNQVQATQGLSFIGFDIYGPSDQTATQTYLSANPASKAVWIPEAWSTASGAALDGSPSDDAQWIQSMYTFATSINAAFLIPFYTDDFASYTLISDPPTASSQLISLFQERTPVFSAFQSLAAGAGSSFNSSSSTASSGAESSSNATASTALTSMTSSGIGTSSTSSPSSTVQASTAVRAESLLSGDRLIILAVVALLVLGIAFIFYRRR